MSIWHANYDAKEVFGSRTERWEDKSPRVTVTLQVAQADLYGLVHSLLTDRTAWPYNDVSRWNLFVKDVEILTIRTKYVADRGGDESLTTGESRQIRVTYTPNTSFQHTITTTVGTGSAGTASDHGLLETQTVWVDVTRQIETEFLTMDFNDFQWEDGEPVKRDEAPGKIFRSVKYEVLYHNVFLTQDLEWIIYNYSDTVNNAELTAAYGLITFQEEQVLFTVEDVKPSLEYDRSTLGETPLPDYLTLHNLRCNFHARMGDGTWNKYWRAKIDTAGEEDDSGWYEMQHRQRVDGQEVNVGFQPFKRTGFWFPLWV